MTEITTIQLKKSVVDDLKKLKKHPRQSYNELISNLIKLTLKNNKQYDSYLYDIQKEKMKELWDNKDDEDWDNV